MASTTQSRQGVLSAGRWWGEIVIAAMAYACVYLALSYPLFRHPGSTLFVPDDLWGYADVNLIVWILCWGWTALTRDPQRLFDANIFYPAEKTFAGSEHLLGYAPLFGPTYELTANPVLANHVSILLSFAIAGAGMYGLLRYWRVPIGCAFFGGFINAFFPSRFAALGEPQLLATGLLPIALAHLDSLLISGRLRSALGLAFFSLWQMLCSVYLAFITLAGLASYGVAIAYAGRKHIRAASVIAAAAAMVIVGVSMVVIHQPYSELRSKGVIPEYESAGRMSVYSNRWLQNYVTRPQQIRSGAAQLEGGRLLYVGLVPAIALLGLFLRRRSGEPEWALGAGCALVASGYLLGLGPTAQIAGQAVTLPYSYLADVVPGFSSMRVPSRFGYLFMMGISALTGLGASRIFDRVIAGTNRAQVAIRSASIIAALAITTADYDLRSAKFPTRQVESQASAIPEVYRALGQLPVGPVLELPIPRNALFRDRRASQEMYYSTFHWQPLLNGYTGHAPPSYELIRAVAADLPEPAALDLLCHMTGLRYIISEHSPLSDRWSSPQGLEVLGQFGKKTLFAIDPPCEGSLIERLRNPAPWSDTIEGTRIRPIREVQSESIRYTIPPPAKAMTHREFRIEVEVFNQSAEIWPTLAPAGSEVVAVGYRWETEAGSVYWPLREEKYRAEMFSHDLPPATRAHIQVDVTTPVRPGSHWLVVGLSQGNRWISQIPGRVRVETD